jgi:hypothetical protein
MKLLNKFWFTFSDLPEYSPLNLGCGVTAFDSNDAIKLLEERVFSSSGNLKIKSTVNDVNIETLDPGHIIPNMGIVAIRGIWFPLGY